MKRLIPLAPALILLAALRPSPAAATALTTERVASGLSLPLFVTAPPGDTTRVFIVEQLLGHGTIRTGRIQILNLATGTLLPTPFLTVPSLVLGSEAGLLGLAFHPDYPDSPYFYINAVNGHTVIRRYRVSADPNVADSTSGVDLMDLYQPQLNHNGGWLEFGPDGYLYIALGDGGGAGDTGEGHDPLVGNAQSDTTRLGKILRVDVDAAFPYAIPPSNPWAGSPSPKNEFWAKGLRNPWRCAFDGSTGDLYIADVGQNVWEELDFEPAGSPGGRNYGWRKFEGEALFNCPDPCDSSGLTGPIHVYQHGGAPYRCSITGGCVYRGGAIPGLGGTYFFADYCSNQIWSTRVAGGAVTELTDRTAELAPGGGLTIGSISSFGEDARGEIYLCDHWEGEVYRIVRDPTAVPEREGGGRAGPALAIDEVVPQPSRDGFRFAFTAPARAPVTASLVDASGRRVRTLFEHVIFDGPAEARWDGRDDHGRPAPAGIYFLRVVTSEGIASRRVTVVR